MKHKKEYKGIKACYLVAMFLFVAGCIFLAFGETIETSHYSRLGFICLGTSPVILLFDYDFDGEDDV